MPCEEIKSRLDAATAARDRLINGSQVVVIVDAFRSRVEYRPADLATLTAAIARLQMEYQACIAPHRHHVLRKPVQFVF